MYHDLPFALPANARLYARDSAGLFVGVRDFERGELAPVRFAVDDAVDLAHLFALELGLIDPAKTVVLLTGEPEKEESRRRLEALLAVGGLREHPWPHAIYHHLFRLGQLTAAEGLMIASFATHGFSDQGKALLAPAGTLRRRLVHTGLPLELVLDDLGRSLAEKRLLLVDACRERFEGATRSAGEALEPFGEAFLQAMDASRGCAFLAGASQGGFAFDDPSRGNGVFTGALLDGLRGEVEGDDEALVTVAALAAFANQRVKDWVRQNKPQYARVSLGISSSFDPESMRGLPLAIDGKRQLARFERQRNEALAQLLRQLGPRDALYQQALTAVEVERPETLHFDLLREMAEFDGSPRHRRSVAGLLAEIEDRRKLAEQIALMKALAEQLGVTVAPSETAPRSSVAEMKARSESAQPIKSPDRARPFWAAVAGSDDFGTWAELRVGKASQRLRWIAPGEFLMGSPEGEAGRLAIEGPQHRVTLTRGFWLGDTPCTQALYQALIERNPSQLASAQRPVEDVSFHLAQDFLKQLNKLFHGLAARLPSEAEWEYACRAGTTTATYAGDLEILGRRNAPVLDAIAWYGGNSGHRFDLKSGGVPSGAWKEKQYPHHTAGTREVARKQPNAWGLYDMLGNVWEWCGDATPTGETGYGGQDRRDPFGEKGTRRIYRGGSWIGYAARVRAAFRASAEPGYRGNDLGFRIAIGEPAP